MIAIRTGRQGPGDRWNHMGQTGELGKLVRRLFEDDHYLFVAKPAGLRVTGPGQAGETGVRALAGLFDTGNLLPVHALAEHVSGVLPLAKSAEAASKLADVLRSPRSTTQYQALVEGAPRRAPLAGKVSRKAAAPTLSLQVLRRRRERSVVSFPHPAARTADVLAALRAAKLLLIGQARRRGDQPPARPVSRLFLHRTEMQLKHPYTGRTLHPTAPLPRAFDTGLGAGDLLEDALQVAMCGRIPVVSQPDTDCYRLFTGKQEGIPGLVAERVGPVVILQTLQGKFAGDRERIRRIGKWYARTVGAAAVYHKRFVRGRDQAIGDDPELHAAVPLVGKPSAEEITVTEAGLRFQIRPHEGFSTGLFLDQRENRRRVREEAGEARVLNAFAYTCGFSVAAAVGGAAQTVSVDISAKALEWGRRNFAANGVKVDDHQFIRSEVFAYLGRARRQERTFDLIILDAPTFARSKRPSRVFSVAEHLRSLVAEACGVLAPGGIMFVSTNLRSCSGRWLHDQVATAAAEARRSLQIMAKPAIPLDFAADPEHAKSMWARFP